MTVSLEGIGLVVFDKDGTLIEFGSMWSGWAVGLADALDEALAATARRSITKPLFEMLGYDPATGTVLPGGGLAATPMARLRDRTATILRESGLTAAEADQALDVAWHAPDPVALARPLGDLPALFGRLRAASRRVAIATSDDRDPTERTLAALGVIGLIDMVMCADDGIPVKPAPDMVLHCCAELGIEPERTAVVGDSPADLAMARGAGAGQVIGVLTGVGTLGDLEPLADAVIDSIDAIWPAQPSRV